VWLYDKQKNRAATRAGPAEGSVKPSSTCRQHPAAAAAATAAWLYDPPNSKRCCEGRAC
jgi:hypothetical protein